jgi:hypothetical protein
MSSLLSYYEGVVNYTLAGYNCKVLSTLFTKKPTNVHIILNKVFEFHIQIKQELRIINMQSYLIKICRGFSG